MPARVDSDPTRIATEAWSRHRSYHKNNEHLNSGQRYIETLIKDPSQFTGLEFRTHSVPSSNEAYTEIVLTPTPEEVVAVLCGDENMARTFNTASIGVEDRPIVAFHVSSYDPGDGGPRVSTLGTVIISPSNPDIEKIGFACGGSSVYPVTARGDDGWFEVSIHYNQTSWRAHSMASFNRKPLQEDHDNSITTSIMSSAYRWAGRLLEARRIKPSPQPTV